ncbi:3-coathanger stack domain-containing protein [Jiulongibacter sp. NS-SX5]|uniref:3-coathanger stack domain-containing protein n=1 Tax=Jiulongibacter sp. NS-SX5 TaxID=3463854 RepID=UPI0040585A75
MQKLLLILTILFISLDSRAQDPALIWQRSIGGSGDDIALQAAQSLDGSIYIAGTSSSSNGNIPGNNGLSDIYLAKLDDEGNELWSRHYGGTGADSLSAIAACADGGVVLLCKSSSSGTTLDFTQVGAYVLKINSTGSVVFNTFQGGEPTSQGSILETSDNNYLFLSTKDIASKGRDLWLRKVNSSGNLVWEQTYGGAADETPNQLLEDNGTYFMLGETLSSSVSSVTSNGGSDLLWAKSTSSGSISNINLLGGSADEFDGRMVFDETGLIYIASTSFSSSSGDIFGLNNGGADVWLFQVNQNGIPELGTNDLIGDDEDEYLGGLTYNPDLFTPTIAVESFSDTLYDQAAGKLPSNIFLLQTIPFGGVDFAIPLGGSGSEGPYSLLGTFDGGFLITGESTSSNGDVASNQGGIDFAVFKLGYPCPSELDMGLKTFNESVSRTADQFIKTASKFQGNTSHIKLKSGYILMEPGFETSSGVVFKTEIGGCP